jgi:hypothetical protein
MDNKIIIILAIAWALCILAIEFAHAEDGVLISPTITDDGEDWDVIEYSLPINNQHQEIVDLKTEYQIIKTEKQEVKKEEPILPTGYSILVQDEMIVYPIHGNVSIWTQVKCQKLEEQKREAHFSEFDKIHIQHEQQFKNWR